QVVLRRERNDPIAARVEIGIGGNQQRADALVQECGKGGVQLRVVTGPRYDDPLADLPRGLFQVVQLTCGGREVRIEDRAEEGDAGHEFVQQAKSFRLHLV